MTNKFFNPGLGLYAIFHHDDEVRRYFIGNDLHQRKDSPLPCYRYWEKNEENNDGKKS